MDGWESSGLAPAPGGCDGALGNSPAQAAGAAPTQIHVELEKFGNEELWPRPRRAQQWLAARSALYLLRPLHHCICCTHCTRCTLRWRLKFPKSPSSALQAAPASSSSKCEAALEKRIRERCGSPGSRGFVAVGSAVSSPPCRSVPALAALASVYLPGPRHPSSTL